MEWPAELEFVTKIEGFRDFDTHINSISNYWTNIIFREDSTHRTNRNFLKPKNKHLNNDFYILF